MKLTKKKILSIFLVIIFFIPTVAFLIDRFFPRSTPQIKKIMIYEDISVMENNPNTNYGQSAQLKLNGNYNDKSWVYIKIRYHEDVGSFYKADLNLYVPTGCNSLAPVDVYLSSSDDWGEGSPECHGTSDCIGTKALCWHNKPSHTTFLGRFQTLEKAGIWYSVDVTSLILQSIKTDKEITLIFIQEESIVGNPACFSSSEASEDLKPFVLLR